MSSLPASKPFRRCILHIGCEKTGTSTIQRFLSLNRRALKKEGILYPLAGGSRYGGSQWGYAVAAQESPWLNDMGRFFKMQSAADQENYAQQLRNKLLQEIPKLRKVSTLLISSEHFHSRLRSSEEVQKVRAFFEPLCESFLIVAYFRRQDRVAVSLYSTHLKSGNPDPKPFLPTLDLPECYYYNYAAVYRNWASVFGQENVVCRIFQRPDLLQGDLLADFCAIAGVNPHGKATPEVQNASLAPEAARYLMEVNRLWHENQLGEQFFDRTILIKELEKNRRGTTFPFGAQTALQFYKSFQESNAEFAAIAFPERTESLFDEDFSDYPDEPNMPDADYSIAVAISLEVYRGLIEKMATKR